jgi:hypothetical protein
MKQKKNGYWTFEKCKEEALKYDTRTDFLKNSCSAYSKARKKKWINVICLHMNYQVISWNKEKIIEKIKEYESFPEIRRKNNKLYAAICRYKLNDVVYELLGRTGNRFSKCIYSYEFPDNHVYVGLTYNIDKRQKNRDKDKNDAVSKHIKNNNIIPIRKQLTEYIPVDEAIKLEEFYVEKYKNEGWVILNRTKTGAIGGVVVKWTKDACKLEASKYNTIRDFRNNSSSAYVTAKTKKWLTDICSHMLKLKEKDGTFTKEKCREIACEYNSLVLFIKENVSCYTIAKRNNWIPEITKHMVDDKRKPNGYWNKEYCFKLANECENINDFKKKYPNAYDSMRKKGHLNELKNVTNLTK